MEANFSNFLDLQEYVEKNGAILIPENWDWAKKISMLMPKPELDLPVVHKTARISHLLDKKNPIYIGLSDGTKLFFTHDEFKRIEGKPERGKDLIVVMQRRPEDTTELPSMISKCIVKP